MSVVTVTQNPNQIQSSYAGGYLVHNAGANTAYLGLDSSVGVGTQAVSLVPGASLTWNGELWAVADQGKATTLEIALQGSGHSAPGPSNVNATLSGPVSLANGTAVGINGTVPVNGSVGVSGPVGLAGGTTVGITGTAQVAGTVGAQAQNAPTLLDTIAVNVPAGAQSGFSLINKQYSTAGYSSLVIAISGGYGAGASLVVTGFISGLINQYIGGSYPNGIGGQNAEWLLDAAMTNSLQVPVIGDMALFNFTANQAAAAPAANITIRIYGTSETVQKPRYVSQSGHMVGNPGFYTRAAAVGTATDFVPSYNGDASVSIYGSGTAGYINLFVATQGATKGFTALYTSTTPVVNGSFATIKIPCLPLVVQSQASTGAPVVGISQ